MSDSTRSRYSRILVKLSGEALLAAVTTASIRRSCGASPGRSREIVQSGTQVAVVVGGGNIFRGAGLARAGMDRVTADHMGMLATVMNAVAMQDALESSGCSRV